jgi:LysM repeat protein
MDRKIKLLAVASMTAIMASGCSSYRGFGSQNAGASDGGGYGSGGGQVARTGQVSRGGLFGQRRASTTCAACAASSAPKSTYTYKPAAKPVYKAAPKPARPAGQHNQQYYIDRWNRQQAQQKNRQPQKNYTGYGNTGASNTTYYDYSSAGKTAPAAPAPNVSASNKSIYTGSYQQPTYKPYQPTTYSGGSAGTTNTATTATATTASGSTYIVKKGDTVFEVMRQTGVYWKDIISMNNLVAPAYNINPGQTLRLK